MTSNQGSDHDQIRQVLALYCFAVDFGDEALFLNCFMPDAINERLEPPFGSPTPGDPVRVGHAGLTTYFRNIQANKPASPQIRHVCSNSMIVVEGDTAKTSTYWVGVLAKDGDAVASLKGSGMYFDEFVRDEGTWRISYRRIRFDPQPARFDLLSGEAFA